MIKISEKFLTDAKGHRIGVQLNIKDYRKLLKKLEELDDIHAYEAAKARGGKPILFAKAVRDIEKRNRK